MTLKRYGFGLDLGEVKDFTALVAFDIELRRHGRPMGPGKARLRPYYDLIGLERVKAGVREELIAPYRVSGDSFYDSIIRWAGEMLLGHPFHGDSFIVVDVSGLDRGTTRHLLLALLSLVKGIPIYPIQIRKLLGKTRQVENGLIQISRADLLTMTALVMEQGRIAVGGAANEEEELELLPELKKELMKVTKNPKPSKDEEDRWRVGAHDDMALAACSVVAIAEQLAGGGVGGLVPIGWR